MAESIMESVRETARTLAEPITKPGIFHGLPYADYAAIMDPVTGKPAVNKSLLGQVAITPADGLAYLEDGGEMTQPLEFGIGAHALLLEPGKFIDEFAIGPDVKLNTNAGKAEWQNFADRHAGKTLIRGKDGALMMGMRRAIMEHAVAKSLLSCKGQSELTMVWRDELSGLLCKLRVDWFIESLPEEVAEIMCRASGSSQFKAGQVIALDYKTSVDAAIRMDGEGRICGGFPKSYGLFKYFLGEAFYRDGIEAATDRPVDHYLFLAQEKKTPFKCNVLGFHSRRVDQGRAVYRELLALYAECCRRNEWPAYDNRNYFAAPILDVEVPEYAMRGAE